MSEVFSFRLSADDPNEAAALDILAELFEQGFELRLIVTDALIIARDRLPLRPRPPDELRDIAAELRAALADVHALAERLQRNGAALAPPGQASEQGQPVSEALIAGLRRATRPGRHL